jgi:molybdopterin synthase catalytic subunit
MPDKQMRIPVHTSLSSTPVPEGHVFDSPVHGAEVQFRGVVRDIENGRSLSGLRYSAYAAMAEKKLREIAEEAAQSHAGARIFIHHVVGFVPAGRASVLIAVAMPRSDAAFDLCREILRRLKTEVPIWKEPVETES